MDWREKLRVPGLLAWSAMLVLGELLGLSLGPYASLWPSLAFFATVALVWAWSRPVDWRTSAFAFAWVTGVVLGARTEANRRHVDECAAGLHGRVEAWNFPVEEEAVVWESKIGVRRCSFPSHAGPLPVKVSTALAEGMRPPRTGDVWRCRGWLEREKDGAGRFQRRNFWVKNQGMELVSVCGEDSPRRRYAKLAEALSRRASIGLERFPTLAALNRAILLGRRAELTPALRRTFSDAGTVHLFAISGLHVMLVAGIALRLMALLSVDARWRGALALPFVAGYVILTGARPSAVRAAVMAAVWLLAPCLGRRANSLSAWAIALALVVGPRPEMLFDLGCLLSFTVMLGILVWLRLCSGDVTPESRFAAFAGDFEVTAAAWMAGMPICACAFNRFTLGGLLANQVVMRCASPMVAFGAWGIALGFFSDTLAGAFNLLAAASVAVMVGVSSLVAALPFASLEVRAWSAMECLTWWAAAGALMAWWASSRSRAAFRFAASRACARAPSRA